MPDTRSSAPGPRLEAPSRLTLRLSLADYRHERIMSSCAVLALAAVLTPLLVLFGLKYGIISSLLDPLIDDPRYREITPLASGRFDPAWFEAMRAREDIAFIVPRTRTIAASIRLRAPDGATGRIIDVELVPSAAGDPLLPRDLSPADGLGTVILSSSTAEKLVVQTGDRVEGIVGRTRRETVESVRIALEVAGVAPVAAFPRDGMFVSVALLTAVEDFLDGRAVPALGWEGTEARTAIRSFAGFRLYARSIDDVESLRRHLAAENVEIRTSLADISLVRRLERNLAVAYWMIALIAISGSCVSFAASVWANVDRKRREFSVLRLTGFSTGQIVWFPILQAGFTALLAWFLACGVYLTVQGVLNSLFAQSIGGGASVCRLEAWHLLVALGVTLLAAAVSAAVGGRRVAELEPSIGLREG